MKLQDSIQALAQCFSKSLLPFEGQVEPYVRPSLWLAPPRLESQGHGTQPGAVIMLALEWVGESIIVSFLVLF